MKNCLRDNGRIRVTTLEPRHHLAVRMIVDSTRGKVPTQ